MTAIRFIAIPTGDAEHLRGGGADANGQIPERRLSDGNGVPCRHCLKPVDEGDPYLVLAYRPFGNLQPYAELGPIFIHADDCPRHTETRPAPPPALASAQYLVRGYNADERIIYGTGQIVATDDLTLTATAILERDDISYLHVRSASNNCYQCRIERA